MFARSLVTAAMLAGIASSIAVAPAHAEFDFAAAEKSAIGIIAEACANKWGTEYEMQVYCRKTETEAMKAVYRLAKEIKTGTADYLTPEAAKVAGDVMNACFQKWPGEYGMIAYCFRNQMAAYAELQRSP